ncbi:dihydrodipicolinate synthase [Tamlana nanhaiensis]|uniref:Dihydrodipicolinate synthase n=1 Tax=Neotamlana nanhaiensis TaxID=1382798 RepID=A0A0D7W5Q9_9FLAO|nr:dihydrodipicolinate synthase family protein [Tamlana nanhaiensis]KJD34359.1 dihydrodipicolinate synthase [Tamlana nanhaiensis]
MFNGIITPMVTPLQSDNLSLDIANTNKLINHIISGGVHGLFILGTTGEATSLSYKTRIQLINEACNIVNNRIPVFVGISDTTIEESVHLAEIAKEAGAKAVVAAPPFYYGLGQIELYKYYCRLADQLPLPLFLYNMPSHTKINIEIDTVLKLAQHDNIIGLKDSSANIVYYQKLCYLLKNIDNFSLLVGPEEVTSQTVIMGGHGGVNGGSNMFPKLYVQLYKATLARDFERVHELQSLVMEVSTKIYNLGSFGSSYLKGMKAGLFTLNLIEHNIAPPFDCFDEKEMTAIATNIKALKSKIDSALS